jgi:hypothetical protein
MIAALSCAFVHPRSCPSIHVDGAEGPSPACGLPCAASTGTATPVPSVEGARKYGQAPANGQDRTGPWSQNEMDGFRRVHGAEARGGSG